MIYDNVISLGYWCGPALELRRINRRRSSYPFDWLIVDMQEVLRLINSDFDDFLTLEHMEQYANNQEYYRDSIHNIYFYHDFNGYSSLESQIKQVRTKYMRRIMRFKQSIQSPTLFIRYIRDESECVYIKSHLNEIYDSLKKYCPQNEICFVGKVEMKKYDLPNFYGGQ